MVRRWKVALGACGAFILATSSAASAFQINPRCQHLGDNSRANQIACTCAVQNGGIVKHWHGRYVWSLQVRAAAVPPEFRECIKANGGHY
jgi:hypothetical protein